MKMKKIVMSLFVIVILCFIIGFSIFVSPVQTKVQELNENRYGYLVPNTLNQLQKIFNSHRIVLNLSPGSSVLYKFDNHNSYKDQNFNTVKLILHDNTKTPAYNLNVSLRNISTNRILETKAIRFDDSASFSIGDAFIQNYEIKITNQSSNLTNIMLSVKLYSR